MSQPVSIVGMDKSFKFSMQKTATPLVDQKKESSDQPGCVPPGYRYDFVSRTASENWLNSISPADNFGTVATPLEWYKCSSQLIIASTGPLDIICTDVEYQQQMAIFLGFIQSEEVNVYFIPMVMDVNSSVFNISLSSEGTPSYLDIFSLEITNIA